MLKLCKVTKVKVLFPVRVSVFHSDGNFNSFKSVAATLEKGLLDCRKFRSSPDAVHLMQHSCLGVTCTVCNVLHFWSGGQKNE